MNGGHGEKLGRKREEAIAALLTEPTIEAAAAKVEIGYRTLRNWLREPEFAKAYAAARRQLLEHALSRLQAVTGRAVSVLGKLLGTEDEKIALATALGVIDRAAKGAEMLDLLARVEVLEEAQRAQEGK
jgi:hypothetical protein